MITAEKIRTEFDPCLREIYAHGWDYVVPDEIGGKLTLVNSTTKAVKKIELREYRNCVMELKYKEGLLPDGTTHTWIRESDGSADKFRELIKPEA